MEQAKQYKTGSELLEMIEKTDQIIANLIRVNISTQNNDDLLLHKYGSAEALIRQTFVWHHTPQGFEYWHDIGQSFRFIK